MFIELAMAGWLQCHLVHEKIVEEDLNCYYICTDTSKEFASTSKQFQCPKVIYEDRPSLPFNEQDRTRKWELDD